MRRLAALTAVAVLSVAVYWTLRLAIADQLFRSKSLPALGRAVRLAPANAQYFAWLAEYQEAEGLDPDPALAAAAELNPLDSSIKISRAVRAEFKNDFAAAEKFLLEAAAVDKLFDPRAALANFYFRRNNPELFWRWTRAALAIGYGDLTSLFRLCWRMSADPDEIRERALPPDRRVMRQYLRFLLSENHLAAAEPIATQLAAVAENEDTPAVLDFIDRQLASSTAAWNGLCVRGQIPFAPIHRPALTNTDFHVAPTSRGFDWRLPSIDGISAVRVRPSSLRIDLSGKQPERCDLLVQFVVLTPGKTCHLQFNYQTQGFPAESGIAWRLRDPTTGADLQSTSPQLSSPEVKHADIVFRARDTSQARLVLEYSRVPGTSRLEGSVTLRDMDLGCEP